MTRLYRTVPITSAEQAEGMPEGTIATLSESPHVTKGEDGVWRYAQGAGGALSKMLVGADALVPIEAEEETTHKMRTSRGIENFAPSYGIFQAPSRRLVTPWEEA